MPVTIRRARSPCAFTRCRCTPQVRHAFLPPTGKQQGGGVGLLATVCKRAVPVALPQSAVVAGAAAAPVPVRPYATADGGQPRRGAHDTRRSILSLSSGYSTGTTRDSMCCGALGGRGGGAFRDPARLVIFHLPSSYDFNFHVSTTHTL